jgi:hypothetical protein
MSGRHGLRHRKPEPRVTSRSPAKHRSTMKPGHFRTFVGALPPATEAGGLSRYTALYRTTVPKTDRDRFSSASSFEVSSRRAGKACTMSFQLRRRRHRGLELPRFSGEGE